jgi:type II secretory pathway pseudopilin PulG
MLVVISIIAVLVALAVPAVMYARTAAKNAAIVVEVGQIDTAFKNYKSGRGDYPTDFAGVAIPAWTASGTATVLRHLQTAFPRYVPGVSTNGALTSWAGFRADVLGNLTTDPWYNSSYPTYEGWGIDVNTLSPSTAIVFFLGGKPNWFLDSSNHYIYPPTVGKTNSAFDANKPVQGFLGFSANVSNPFDNSTSRIRPLYDFDIPSVGWMQMPVTGTPTIAGLVYWAKNQSVGDGSKTSGPMVYFRAENGNYTMDGNPPPAGHAPTDLNNSNFKYEGLDRLNTSPPLYYIAPAVDTRYSNFLGMGNYNSSKGIVYTWVNPQGFQIFTSGLDLKFAKPYIASLPTPSAVDCVAYPTGESYWVDTSTNSSPFDDITNFSGGTLQSAMRSTN